MNPKNSRTPLIVLGGIQLATADSLFGSHSKPARPTMCPKNGTLVLKRLHFVDLSCSPYSATRFSTSSKLYSADFKVIAKHQNIVDVDKAALPV